METIWLTRYYIGQMLKPKLIREERYMHNLINQIFFNKQLVLLKLNIIFF